jgi:hypothetical protein
LGWRHRGQPKAEAPTVTVPQINTPLATQPPTAPSDSVTVPAVAASIPPPEEKAKFRDLWDEAYESLSKEKPRLICKYEEILLSRDDTNGADAEGKPGWFL